MAMAYWFTHNNKYWNDQMFFDGARKPFKATQQINPECSSVELLYPVKILTEIKTSEDLHLKETPLRQSTS